MKLRITLGFVLVAVTLGLTFATVSAARPTVQSAPVMIFNTSDVVPDASANLVRTDSGILGLIHSVGLQPGHVYTLWWVTVESPENCDGECGLDDVLAAVDNGNPAGISVLYASGGSVSGDSAVFVGYLGEGDESFCIAEGDGPFSVLCKPLVDSHDVQVHLVVRDHGPLIPGQLYSQAATFTGGCSTNSCTNVHAAVFD